MAGDAVQQIKERLSIVEVISPYVELHQAGRHFKGKSPFTSEKTPSFYVSPDRGMYYCFSSSQGGDMFTFIEAMEGVDFKGALKILADKAGIELVPEDPKKRSERDQLYAILESATKYFESELLENAEAKRYLTDRSVSEETIRAWRLGYVPGPPKAGWRHTREYLTKNGYTDTQLQKAGLVKEAGQGKEPYDVFRDRVMFPIADSSGRVVAFSGRILTKDSDAPKYVNSPETELFSKSDILFGYHKAKEGIRKLGFSLIVEGQFDVVLSHQAGYHNAVAVSGTALTPQHVNLLQRLSNRVVLALDADRAGIAAVKRAADLMLSRGIDLKVARLPDGKDPADLAAEGADVLKKTIGGSQHVIEFLLGVLKNETADSRTLKLRARDEIVPYLLKIDSHMDREHFVSIIAEQLGTTADAISLEVKRLEQQAEHKQEAAPQSVSLDPVPTRQPELRVEMVRNYLVVATAVLDRDLSRVIEDQFKLITGETTSAVEASLPSPIVSELTFKLEQQFNELTPIQLKEELTDKLRELHEFIARTAIREEKEKLQQAEQNGDEVRINECLETLTKWQKKLSEDISPIVLFSVKGD